MRRHACQHPTVRGRNVVLTRYKRAVKLKDWALAIAARSTMRKARIALARRLAIIPHAMLRDRTEFNLARLQVRRDEETETSSRAGATPEGGSG